MFIKKIETTENFISYECSPVFSTAELVQRCRTIVDDYFTFVNYEKYTHKYNFRKYCLEPEFSDFKIVYQITIQGLKFKDLDINVVVKRTGPIIVLLPKDIEKVDISVLESAFERTIKYAL